MNSYLLLSAVLTLMGFEWLNKQLGCGSGL